MSKTDTVSPLRQRMIEDMAARKLNPHTQRSHISSCKRFAAWLKRSPDTATADEVRRFQLHLIESGASICNRNRIMTGVRFLFRVTLRRHDLAAEIWHLKEPQTLPPVLSPEEVKRVLTMATSLKARAMLTLAYGCGLRASEVVRLRACDIDSEQMIIRIVQSKGRKDRNVMLPAEILDLLRRWWKSRPTRRDAGVAPEQRWLFPGRIDRHPTTARQFGRLFNEEGLLLESANNLGAGGRSADPFGFLQSLPQRFIAFFVGGLPLRECCAPAKIDGLATSGAKRESPDVERCGRLTVTEVGHDGGQISPRDHVEQFLLVDRKTRPDLPQVVDRVDVGNDRVMAGAFKSLVMEAAACALPDDRGIGHRDCAERLALLQGGDDLRNVRYQALREITHLGAGIGDDLLALAVIEFLGNFQRLAGRPTEA